MDVKIILVVSGVTNIILGLYIFYLLSMVSYFRNASNAWYEEAERWRKRCPDDHSEQ